MLHLYVDLYQGLVSWKHNWNCNNTYQSISYNKMFKS